MGAIIDILHLGKNGINLVKAKYSGAIITNMTKTDHIIQRYRVIITTEDWYEDNYYNFLVDNSISMSSTVFCTRIESDQKFAERMRARVANTIENKMERKDSLKDL